MVLSSGEGCPYARRSFAGVWGAAVWPRNERTPAMTRPTRPTPLVRNCLRLEWPLDSLRSLGTGECEPIQFQFVAVLDGTTIVKFRFGTWPTLIFATSFNDAMSTTSVWLPTGSATSARFPR